MSAPAAVPVAGSSGAWRPKPLGYPAIPAGAGDHKDSKHSAGAAVADPSRSAAMFDPPAADDGDGDGDGDYPFGIKQEQFLSPSIMIGDAKGSGLVSSSSSAPLLSPAGASPAVAAATAGALIPTGLRANAAELKLKHVARIICGDSPFALKDIPRDAKYRLNEDGSNPEKVMSLYLDASTCTAIEQIYLAVKNSPHLQGRNLSECLLGDDLSTLSPDTPLNRAFVQAAHYAFILQKLLTQPQAYNVSSKLNYTSAILARMLKNMHNACGEHY